MSIVITSPGGGGGTGTVGPTGPAGPEGPQGPAGPQGDPGPQGPAGAAGADGAQGPKGDTGATGLQGPKGDTGAAGATGAQGPAGADGAQGPQGDPGPSSWAAIPDVPADLAHTGDIPTQVSQLGGEFTYDQAAPGSSFVIKITTATAATTARPSARDDLYWLWKGSDAANPPVNALDGNDDWEYDAT